MTIYIPFTLFKSNQEFLEVQNSRVTKSSYEIELTEILISS